MCNTATLRACLSGSGAFPLLKAVGNGEGGLGSPLDFGRSVNQLFQPGGQIIPTSLLLTLPRVFKPSYGPAPRHGISFVL